MKNRYQLREEYAKHGIDFTYNDRQRVAYLKIKGAPTFVEGGTYPENCAPLTGWYRVYGGIKDAQEVEILSQRAKELYREQFADNPQMLKYLDPKEAELSGLFVFDEELCVQDDKHEVIDGYLWATDGLVSKLKAQLAPHLSADEMEDMENINFYALFDTAKGTMELLSSFWYTKDGGYHMTAAEEMVPLTGEEAAALYSAMESYCQKRYHMSCQAFLNEAREECDLPPMTLSPVTNSTKPSLNEKISDAAKRQQTTKDTQERPEPALAH